MEITNIKCKNVILGYKSLDVSKYVESTETVSNNEFSNYIVDNSGKVVWGEYLDGTLYEPDIEGNASDGTPLSKIINKVKNTFYF